MSNEKWKMNPVALAVLTTCGEAALVHTITGGSTKGPICGPL